MCSGSKGLKIIGVLALLGAVAAFVTMWPDLQRYIKTEMM
ncbi:MAG: DUF6893 family small protein [Terriglobia bacterium]